MGFLKLLLGFMIGLSAGWGIGRLYAPTSGASTRQTIRARYEEIAAEAREAGDAKQLEMQARYQAAKQAGAMAPDRPRTHSRR
jgi:gas vesicle protein